jgi:hypothetical protein
MEQGMSDFWEAENKKATFAEWLDAMRGCKMCNCDHGCNQWIVSNAGKTVRLFEALAAGAPPEELDRIVQMHTKEVNRGMYEEMWAEAKAKRQKKDD